MILNVKKSNFIIYLVCLLIGIVLIGISIAVYYINDKTVFDELLLSIGCSTVPTVITAYLIDQSAEKREAKRINELRNHFLWGAPHGFLWIMKTIAELYSPYNDSDSKTFFELFEDSIQVMSSKSFEGEDLLSENNEIKNLLDNHNLGYGIDLCQRDCKSMIDHSYELEIHGVFTKDQLLSITYLFEECSKLKSMYRICEMAEVIELFVKTMVDSITELKEMVERNAIFKKRRLMNWLEISKQP